jgi:hypothetical protein
MIVIDKPGVQPGMATKNFILLLQPLPAHWKLKVKTGNETYPGKQLLFTLRKRKGFSAQTQDMRRNLIRG